MTVDPDSNVERRSGVIEKPPPHSSVSTLIAYGTLFVVTSLGMGITLWSGRMPANRTIILSCIAGLVWFGARCRGERTGIPWSQSKALNFLVFLSFMSALILSGEFYGDNNWLVVQVLLITTSTLFCLQCLYLVFSALIRSRRLD